MYVSYNENIMKRVYNAIHEIPQSIPGSTVKSPEAIVLALWATASEQVDHRGEGDVVLAEYKALNKSQRLYQSELSLISSPYCKAWEAAFEDAAAYESQIYLACVVTLALAPIEEYEQMTWEQILPKVQTEFKADRKAFNDLVERSLSQAWAEKPQ